MIPRVYDDLDKLLKKNKVVVIYGPRRVGKSTLLQNYLRYTRLKYRLGNGDDAFLKEVFSSQSFAKIKKYAEGYELIVIDEAQRIPNVGLGLKILVDQVPEIMVVITGSASLDLSYKVGEPLVGRKFTYILYPVSQKELSVDKSRFDLESECEKRLIFGSYPEVLEAKTEEEKIKILSEIASSYLFKDIIEIERIGDIRLVLDLLKLIAFQVGNEVSLTELGSSLGIDKKTVARYLYLLEQSFILYNLRGFSRNLRKEVTKKSKYYFYDNGIRNAIIKNFNDLSTRNDTGALWKNFIVIERLKKQAYQPIYSSNYFWRTWDKQEIDWVEMRGGKLFGYEIKSGRDTSSKAKKIWLETYNKEGEFEIVNKDNYQEFIL